MTRVATIDTRRFLALLLIATMLITTLLVAIAPRAAHAAETGTVNGHFTLGNSAPVINSVTLNNNAENETPSIMIPQVEYAINVDITDINQLSSLDYITVKVLYDSVVDGFDDNVTNMPADDTQTACTFTCNVTATPTWSQSLGSPSTWAIVTGDCTTPTLLTDPNGVFSFHFKPGKVATEASTGSSNPNWDIYVYVVDESSASVTHYDGSDYGMAWYGQITVNTGSVTWPNVTAGMDFTNTNAKQTGLSMTYVSNGNYDEAVSADPTWGTKDLDTGGNPGPNQFSLKVNDVDDVDTSILVSTDPALCILASGTITTETPTPVSTNALYLKLGSPFTNGTYDGNVYFCIRNG